MDDQRKEELRQLGRDVAGDVAAKVSQGFIDRFVAWVRERVRARRARRDGKLR